MAIITHHATVTAVGPRQITVRLSDSADCSGCGLGMLCGHSRGRSEVTLDVAPDADYKVGSHVVVAAAENASRRAALTLVVAPCLCMFAGAFIAFALGLSQTLSALTGLGAVALWYGVIRALGRRSAAVIWTVVADPKGRRVVQKEDSEE